MLQVLRAWFDRWRALRELRAAQREYSDDWWRVFTAQIGRARDEYDRGDRKKALETWIKTRAQFTDVSLTSEAELNLLFDLGRYDEAEEMMQEGRRRYPSHAPFAVGYARVAYRRGDLEEALRRCEILRRKFPRVAEGYTIAATCFTELGRQQAAEAMFALGAQKLPKDFEMNVELARFAVRRRDWPKALRRWEVVRAQFDHFLGPCGVAECLREMGRYADAETILAETCVRFPRDPWALVGLADIATLRGDLDEATKRWATVRQQFGSFALGYTRGAEVARRAGREAEAEKLLDTAVERCRGDLGVNLEHARSAHRRGDWAAAAERWALVRERFPDCDEARDQEAEALAAMAQQSEAVHDATDQPPAP